MNNTDNIDQIISHTKKWVSEFIISYNICPFAKREFDRERIHFLVVPQDSMVEQLETVIDACVELDGNPEIETTLAIFPHGLDDFDNYLDFLALANALMHKQAYEGVYQLASFHPDYHFEGVEADDVSNYTNRSPYPMLHLIREVSLAKALQSYPDPENIPLRNIETTRKLGKESLVQLLDRCKHHTD